MIDSDQFNSILNQLRDVASNAEDHDKDLIPQTRVAAYHRRVWRTAECLITDFEEAEAAYEAAYEEAALFVSVYDRKDRARGGRGVKAKGVS